MFGESSVAIKLSSLNYSCVALARFQLVLRDRHSAKVWKLAFQSDATSALGVAIIQSCSNILSIIVCKLGKKDVPFCASLINAKMDAILRESLGPYLLNSVK